MTAKERPAACGKSPKTPPPNTIGGLATSISHYVDGADAGRRRLEENLDGLIRAITAEHSNGKSQSQ
jgi:hypothetical protein